MDEDDDGYLWVAEQTGLYRFDGDRFTAINLPENLGNPIRQLSKINSDTMLVATTIGLGIVNTKNFKVDTRFFTSASNEYFLEDNFIRWVIKGTDKTYWVFTRTAVHLLDKDLNIVGSIQLEKHPDIIDANPARPICFPVDENKLLLKSFPNNIDEKDSWQLIDIKNGTMTVFQMPELEQIQIGSSFQINSNEIIFVSRSGLVNPQAFYSYNFSERELEKLMEYDDSDAPVFQLSKQLNSAAKGMNFSRFKKGFFYDVELKIIIEEYRNFRPYSKYHKMINGVVYVGNEEGLFRLTPTTITIEKPVLFTEFFKEENFNDQVVDFLKQEKKLYIATHGRHIFSYDSLIGKFENIRLDKPASSRLIWNLRHQGRDSVWIGTQTGLYRYNPLNKKVSRWERSDLPEAINKAPITVQYIDSKGILWIGMGSGNGVLSYNPNNDSVIHYLYNKNKFPLRTTNDIAEDAEANLWMGYENGGGLIKWDRKTNVFSKIKIDEQSEFSNDRIRCLLTDHNNMLWIGTRYGLFRYDISKGTFEKYSVKDGLADDFINTLYQDNSHRIWIGTTNGLSILDYDTQKFLNMNQNQGIPGREISSIKEWDSQGNRLFIGATNGFCIINIKDLLIDSRNYNLYVEPLIVNGISTNLDIDKDIKLNYKQNSIGVNFGIVNHSEGSRNTYYYKVPEIDSSWIELKTKGELRLTGMGAGTYSLNLRTCINGSNCFERFPIVLTIRPPFWKTIWFVLLVILLSVFLTRVFYNLRIRNLKRIEKMRSQISMDLHDDIGSSISSVRILSDILANENPSLQKNEGIITAIKEQSSHIGEVLEEIIWNVNPKNDLLENVILRMQQYANEVLENAGVAIKWHLEIQQKETVIEAEKRKELYLFFKEAVNNIVKHSQCKTVWITISAEAKFLSIQLKDDGVGFDSSKNYPSNGLISMKDRAEKLGATISIESIQNEGTKISFVTPL
jgi:ligand-binding sensor domain-containing protein